MHRQQWMPCSSAPKSAEDRPLPREALGRTDALAAFADGVGDESPNAQFTSRVLQVEDLLRGVIAAHPEMAAGRWSPRDT